MRRWAWSATVTYGHLLRSNGPLAVTTGILVNIGASQTSTNAVALFNGFGGLFQSQADASDAANKTIVTETDSHGWMIGTNNHWTTSGVPGQCDTVLVTEPVAAPCRGFKSTSITGALGGRWIWRSAPPPRSRATASDTHSPRNWPTSWWKPLMTNKSPRRSPATGAWICSAWTSWDF